MQDPLGATEGRVREATYAGEHVEAIAEIRLNDGSTQLMLVRLDPTDTPHHGEPVRFIIARREVPVVKSAAAESTAAS